MEDAELFLFDDVSPLGVEIPNELLEKLAENNQPFRVLNAEEIASKIAKTIPYEEKVLLVSGGGVLTYLFLKRAGYKSEIENIAYIKREYPEGKPICKLETKLEKEPKIIIDDIIASGQTIDTLVNGFKRSDLEIICLIASTNIPKGENGYRARKGSTIPKAEKLYCTKLVNGITNKKPSILSVRYLMTKAIDDGGYDAYLAKKFGGLDNSRIIKEIMARTNREPIDFLRRDPINFIKRYS